MRKLTLAKETLVELSTQELAHVVGASGVSCLSAWICQECITGNRCS
jgi:hypothetical protein